ARGEFGFTWNMALEAGGFLVSDEVKLSIDAQVVAACPLGSSRRGRPRTSRAAPARTTERSGRDRLRVDGELHLVRDDEAARFEGHVLGEAELAACPGSAWRRRGRFQVPRAPQ
ncbi:MAG: hypothetical protein ACKORK_13075, partial [Gemmatimonadota bacterium]